MSDTVIKRNSSAGLNIPDLAFRAILLALSIAVVILPLSTMKQFGITINLSMINPKSFGLLSLALPLLFLVGAVFSVMKDLVAMRKAIDVISVSVVVVLGLLVAYGAYNGATDPRTARMGVSVGSGVYG